MFMKMFLCHQFDFLSSAHVHYLNLLVIAENISRCLSYRFMLCSPFLQLHVWLSLHVLAVCLLTASITMTIKMNFRFSAPHEKFIAKVTKERKLIVILDNFMNNDITFSVVTVFIVAFCSTHHTINMNYER